MTRNTMKLIISNSEVSLVQMALAKEHHDRKGVFLNLQAQGHVKILTTEDPARIHVQIEDEVFHDERARFPTTILMAKLQLAIAAGRSCRNLNRDDDPYPCLVKQPLLYEQMIGRLYRPMNLFYDEYMEYPAPSPPKRVTAAVTKKPSRSPRPKGLRP